MIPRALRAIFAGGLIAVTILLPVAAQSASAPQVWPGAVIDVNEDPAAHADLCARVAAGESVGDVVYDCSSFPAFQVDCSDPERATVDCLTSPAPVPECWDCEGSAMTEAEKLAAACSPAALAANPRHLGLCFPDRYVWTCDPDGTCEFRSPETDADNGLDIPTTPPSPVATESAEPAPTESAAPTTEATPLPTESP